MYRYSGLPSRPVDGSFSFVIYLAPEPCQCALTASWFAIPGTFVEE
jgi:hypothetical protein